MNQGAQPVGSRKICPKHGEKSFFLCKTCNRIICSKCTSCEKHDVHSITELTKQYAEDLKPSYIRGYRKIASKKISRDEDNVRLIIEEVRQLKGKRDTIEKRIPEIKTGAKNDVNLITASMLYLRGVGEKSFTDALRNAVAASVEALDVEDEIQHEVSRYELDVEEWKKNIEAKTNRIEELEAEMSLLKDVVSIRSKMIDEESQTTLLMSFVRGIIKPNSYVPASVEGYSVFPGVELFFEIGKVLGQDLVNVSGAVKISKPVKVSMKLRRDGGSFNTSISHNGIMAIYSKRGNNHGIQFTNIPKDIQAEVEVEDESIVGFYDDSLILLTNYKYLRCCEVNDVFEGSWTYALKTVDPKSWVNYQADVSLLQATRSLIYATKSNDIYKYDVDKQVNTRMDLGFPSCGFANLTGVTLGVKAAFARPDKPGCIFALESTTTVLESNSVPNEIPDTFIHNPAQPTNVKKGIVKFGSEIYVDGVTVKVCNPIKFGSDCSLVRLFNDVFLTYDHNTNGWVLVRITFEQEKQWRIINYLNKFKW